MKFSINPSSSTPSEFNQWKEAIKATTRLPQGLPELFRKDVYLYFLQFLILLLNYLFIYRFGLI
jgi:hypothetical protein